MEKTALGRSGENLAREYLEKKGFHFLCQNYKRLHGEVDLIMEKSGWLVFVEVKTRRSLRYGFPAEAVTPAKQRHLRYCAEVYFTEHDLSSHRARFDVVEILMRPGRAPALRHLENAF